MYLPFWDEARSIVVGLQPIYTVLRLTNREGCTLGLLYEFMDKLSEQLRLCTTISPERFHTLAEFDEGKRSCRKRLAYHNERRRRHQSDSLVKCSGDGTPSKGGSTRTSDFTAEQKVQRMKSSSEISSSPVTFIGFEQNHEKNLKPEQLLMGEPFPLPKSLKSKSARNDAEGQGLRSKSKRSKESEKHWIAPRKVDPHSSEDEIQEDMPGVLPFFLQPKVDLKTYGGAAGDTFDPQYSSSLRVGIELGDGIILPPLAIKRDGKLVLLQEWPGGGGVTLSETDGEDAQRFQLQKDGFNKKEWQKGDQETLFHCLWDCPKVQPVWKWAGRALSKIRGSKVSLEWKQAVLGEKLGGWALPETISVWRLLRGIILGQVWHARKGKVYSGKQWTPGQIIRSTWVDLMMYAMQEWLEVLKAKGSLKQEEAHLLRTRFDKKWLVNGFVGRRTEWSMAWKDSYEVLLD
ncbi:hypothetical protein O6H91_12G083900 [Diphasiastrum complanatum]|uniref:Uncharacterized protein n=1 Tax=Diphasiastrum complanatum TaxID=34168 RepID=A0ACC2C488_DIPCM|nr:hypothetical protein O6H91_12G083900 [Diphasiastrum complanatum]